MLTQQKCSKISLAPILLALLFFAVQSFAEAHQSGEISKISLSSNLQGISPHPDF